MEPINRPVFRSLLGFSSRLYSGQNCYSEEQISERVKSLSSQLKKLSDQGKLAVCSPNSEKALLLALACLEAGWVYQPISPRWPVAIRNPLAEQSESDWIWPVKAFDPKGWAQQPPQRLELDWALESRSKSVSASSMAGPCSTLFTSGSTGQPKAVSHTIQQHLAAADFCNPILKLTADSCWLLSLPLFHASGYAILMRCLRAGAAIALPEKSGITIEDLKRVPVTHVSLVATQLQRLLLEPEFNALSLSLRHLMLGGGSVPEKLLQQALDKGFEVSMSYGMTESAAAIALSEVSADCGIQVSSNAKVRIEQGEIQLKGEQLAKSYQMASGTKKLAGINGWFATGDLGRIEKGKLYIEGRKDNRFISGGENVQPELIEQALLQHPDIQLALVVPCKDAAFGQRPAAFVKARASIEFSSLEPWLRQKLPGFMCPTKYLPWPEGVGIEQKPVRKEFEALLKEK